MRAGGSSRSARRPRATTGGRCGSSRPPSAARWRATPPTPRASSAPAARAAPAAVAAGPARRPARRGGALPARRAARCSRFRAPLRLAPGAAVTLRYAYGAAQPRADPGVVARWRAARRPLGAASGAGRAGCRRSSFGAAARLARARAPVGRVHGALGHDLRGVRGPPRDLPGRLLPVRQLRRPDRLPRPAPAHAPDGLRGARARARRAPVLGPPAARRRRPDRLRHRSRSAGRRSCRPRTTWTCGCCGPRPSTGSPPATSRSSTGGCRSAAAARPRSGGTSSWRTPTRSPCAARTAGTARPPPATGPTSRAPSWRWTSPRSCPPSWPTCTRAWRSWRTRVATAPSPRCCAAGASELRAVQRGSGPGAGTRADTAVSARSAPAPSSASRSPGTSSPGSRTGARRAPWWRASGASSPASAPRRRWAARRGSAPRCRRRPPTPRSPSARAGPGIGGGNAVFVGGVWYAINGWLTWALGELDGVVPRAGAYALDELERNTLAAHAAAFPRRWNGVLSVDDACNSWFAEDPGDCGIDLDHTYAGQIMHQPAWTLYATTRLAGITPTARGYRFTRGCRCGASPCACRAWGSRSVPGSVRGYVRPLPAARSRSRWPTRPRPVTSGWAAVGRARGPPGLVRFRLPTRRRARTSRCRLPDERAQRRSAAAVRRSRPARRARPRRRRRPTASRCAPTRSLLGQAPDWLDRGARGLPRPRRAATRAATGRCTSTRAAARRARAALPHLRARRAQPGAGGAARGSWILFHSWNGHAVTLGGAGFGGIGSDVWVMTRDGRRRTNLTRGPRVQRQLPRLLVARRPLHRLDRAQLERGRGRQRPLRRSASRASTRTAPAARGSWTSTSCGPGNGHWYETQWWAPDGSGFLYTETTGTAINPELFFCRLPDPGARALPALAAHPQPRLGRAGDLHAGHGPRDLHVLARPPRRLRRLVARGPLPRPAGPLRLPADPLRLQRQLPPAGAAARPPTSGRRTLRWSGGRARVQPARAPAAAHARRAEQRLDRARVRAGTRRGAGCSGPRTAIPPGGASTRAA